MKQILLLFSLFLFTKIYAQEFHSCTMEDIEHKHEVSNSSNLRIIYPDYSTDTAEIIRIPVVFNVVHVGEPIGQGSNVSDKAIHDAVDHLNKYYRKVYDPYDQLNSFEGGGGLDTKIEFFIANIDSSCNYTTGIRRFDGRVFAGYESQGINKNDDLELKVSTGTHVSRYLNIWIVNKINPSSVAGYAYYPGGYKNNPLFGIVCNHDNIEGVLPHEIGHFLNLTHEDMEIGGFTRLPSFKIIRQAANYYKQELLGQPFSCTPQLQNDLALTEVKDVKPVFCEGNSSPKVKLINYGSNTITSCIIKVVNGIDVLTDYNWTGSLNALDSAIVTLPTIDFVPASYNLKFFVSNPNGQPDPVHINDTIQLPVRVAGFINSLPFVSDFDNGNAVELTLSSNKYGSVSETDILGYSATGALIFQGTHRESYSGGRPADGFSPFGPFKPSNSEYFAAMDVCLHTQPGKHYKVNFDRYNDAWASSFLRVLGNGQQTKRVVGGRENQWVKDSTVVSSYDSSELLVTIQSACDFSYETKSINGYGDYIVLDNLTIKETPAAAFDWNINLTGSSRGCVPLLRGVVNNSFGAPQPLYYEYLIKRTANEYDTIRTIENPYSFNFEEVGIFDMEIFAHFQNGDVDSVYFPEFGNTTNKNITSELLNFEEDFDWNFGSSRDDISWTITESVGAYGQSPKSLLLDYVDQSSGSSTLTFSITSAPYDMSNMMRPILTFDKAYSSGTEFYSKNEWLAVSVSEDCGDTWTEVYKKTGDKLLTAPYNDDYYFNLFIPSANEWDTDTADISTLSGKNDVLIKFDFHPNFGNSIYLDNIRIAEETATAVRKNNANTDAFSDFVVYPNPATTLLSIDGPEAVSEIVIYDNLGQVVLKKSNTKSVDISNLPVGVYTAKITGNGKVSMKKFVKS